MVFKEILIESFYVHLFVKNLQNIVVTVACAGEVFTLLDQTGECIAKDSLYSNDDLLLKTVKLS